MRIITIITVFFVALVVSITIDNKNRSAVPFYYGCTTDIDCETKEQAWIEYEKINKNI